MIPEAVAQYALLGAVGLVSVTIFLTTPLSNILNIITVPLGYEYSSCPYCPEFGIQKIEYSECDNCGERHGRGYSGAAAYRDGSKYEFCSNECLSSWEGPK
jgi:hypothetical protein